MATGKGCYRVVLLVFLILSPFLCVMDLLYTERTSLKPDSAMLPVLFVGLLLQPISAIGLWRDKAWGRVLLLVATTICVFTAFGAAIGPLIVLALTVVRFILPPTAPVGHGGNDRAGAERPITAESTDTDRPLPEPTWRPQFSLRSMLVLTFAVAVWLSLCRIVPHIAVFVLGIILAAGSTYALRRLKTKVRGCRLRRLDRIAFAVLWTLTLLSWAYFYVVSIGPVIAVAQSAGIPPGGPLRIFYLPVISLHEYTPLAKPMEAYANAWGWH